MELIHLILGKANPNRMNGVNKVVHQLATQQALSGMQVSVWGITKDLSINYDERNFETRLFPAQLNPFSFSKKLTNALHELPKNTIIHLHGGWIPVYYALACYLNKIQLQFVFTPHGAYNTIAMERSSWTKKIYFQLFENKVLQYATKIHCIGKSEILGVQQLFPNKKTVLLPYGFESNIQNNSILTKQEKVVFGFIGRLDIYTKGLDVLVEAFTIVVKKLPQAQLWIVGDSNERMALQQQIDAAQLQKNVLLLGSKFGAEKEEILKNITVFVHPSRNEGLPASVIEAASYGLPCVVTEATNIGDPIIEFNAGKVIADLNATGLAHALLEMEQIWKTGDFSTMQQNAIQMVQETYAWSKVIHNLNQNLYTIS